MQSKKNSGKVGKVMKEFGAGKLHSGSKKGPVVSSPKQAIAIGLSEAGMSKKDSKALHGKIASRFDAKKKKSHMYN